MDYSADAKHIINRFKRYRNSISIYTEDTESDKKFYVNLLQRLLEGTDVVINDVYPIGNCSEVTKRCMEDTSSDPKLYIVDGDINLMTTPKESHEHLFVLDRYCIENYVIDRDAVYSTLDEEDSTNASSMIHSLVNYQEIVQEAITPFLCIYRHYASSSLTTGHFKSDPVERILDEKCEIVQSKVIMFSEAIKKNATSTRLTTNEEYDETVKNLEIKYQDTEENLLKYVSGKDYLIPYIMRRCEVILKLNKLKVKQWKYKLSKNCDINSLNGLKEAILQEIESINKKDSPLKI